MQKAFFLDRDGVIIRDCHLIRNQDDIQIMPGISNFITRIKSLDFKIFVVSNQTVVSRGLLSYNKMIELNGFILQKIKEENPLATIDKCYFCTHHPHSEIEEYRIDCSCRKPKPGMLIQAQNEFNINLSKSYMIGDRTSDIIAGNLAGCTSILFQSGEHNSPTIITTIQVDDNHKIANFNASSLDNIWIYVKNREKAND